MDSMGWAEAEFGDADLGDFRRTNRLVKMSAKIIRSTERNLSESMGSEAENKAAQRFLGNDSFGYEEIIAPAVARTIDEMLKMDRVYLIQDTTHLNYDSHPATKGLGHIGSTKDKSFQGIMMHWTLALNAQAECIGPASLKLWRRDPKPRKVKPGQHQALPIESKESYKWLEAVESLDGLIGPDTQAIWIGDREADIYDFMDLILSKDQDFVIRSNVDRVIDDEEGLLKERIRSSASLGSHILSVPKARGADAEVRVRISCCDISLAVQRRKGGAKSARVSSDREIHAVRVSSQNPRHHFEWILLTSLRVETLEDCLEVIWIYKKRWHIESAHKTLKSGLKAEKLTLDSADKLEKALAMLLPCAIKVYQISQKQKHEPDSPATSVLSPMECMLLNTKNRKSPKYVPTIKEAWYWIGLMGGFRGTRKSAPPGPMTFWRGYIHLRDMAFGAELYQRHLEKKKCVR